MRLAVDVQSLLTQILPGFVAGFIFALAMSPRAPPPEVPGAAEAVRSQGFADAMPPG